MVEERSVVAVAGETIVLPCNVSISNPPSVRWIDYVYNTGREPAVISQGAEVQPTHPNANNFRVNSEYSLTISSLTGESAGLYICESEVGGTTRRLIYQLSVYSMLPIYSVILGHPTIVRRP